MQAKYEGPPDEFGWLILVPPLPEVRQGAMDPFYELSQLTQRRFGVAKAARCQVTLRLRPFGKSALCHNVLYCPQEKQLNQTIRFHQLGKDIGPCLPSSHQAE
ncbi:MAG: hypothetical protein RMH97_00545 [Verrucomicrobiales bacterium]|nr:hypothetical protein [Verrucomicrobiales bacterium]